MTIMIGSKETTRSWVPREGFPVSAPPDLDPAWRPRFPSITCILVILNCVVFIVTVVVSRSWPYLYWPAAGMDWGPLSLTGQWWRFVTSPFIHTSAINLFSNLLLFGIVGPRVERTLGKWQFLLFCVICGVVGSLASLAIHPELKSCGASAQVFGLVGGLISIYTVKRLTLSTRERWKLLLIILWSSYTIYEGVHDPVIDNASHVGALLSGLILGSGLVSLAAERKLAQFALLSGAAGLSILGFGLARHYHAYMLPLGSAIRALHQAHTQEALRELDVASRMRPDSSLVSLLIAQAYLERDDYEQAESASRRAATIDQRSEYVKYFIGMAELKGGPCAEVEYIARQLSSEQDVAEREALARAAFDCDLIAVGDRFQKEGNLLLAEGCYQIALRIGRNANQAQARLAEVNRNQMSLPEVLTEPLDDQLSSEKSQSPTRFLDGRIHVTNHEDGSKHSYLATLEIKVEYGAAGAPEKRIVTTTVTEQQLSTVSEVTSTISDKEVLEQQLGADGVFHGPLRKIYSDRAILLDSDPRSRFMRLQADQAVRSLLLY